MMKMTKLKNSHFNYNTLATLANLRNGYVTGCCWTKLCPMYLTSISIGAMPHNVPFSWL